VCSAQQLVPACGQITWLSDGGCGRAPCRFYTGYGHGNPLLLVIGDILGTIRLLGRWPLVAASIAINGMITLGVSRSSEICNSASDPAELASNLLDGLVVHRHRHRPRGMDDPGTGHAYRDSCRRWRIHPPRTSSIWDRGGEWSITGRTGGCLRRCYRTGVASGDRRGVPVRSRAA